MGYVASRILKPVGLKKELWGDIPSIIERKKSLLVYFVFVMSFLDLLLTFVLGLGVAGSNASIGYISFLLPFFIVYPLIVYIVFTAWDKLSLFERYCIYVSVGLMLLAGFVSGSRAFILNLSFPVFVYLFLFKQAYHRRRVLWLVLWVLVILSLVYVNFYVGINLRYYLQVNGLDYNVFFEIGKLAVESLNPDYFYDIIGVLTSRISGFDGLLVTNIQQHNELKDLFSFMHIVKRILAGIVPFVGSGEMDSGRAVAVYYHDSPRGSIFASSIGFFGYINILYGSMGVIYLFFYGFILGLIESMFVSIKDNGIRYLFFVIISHFVLYVMISGNLDKLVAALLIKSLHIFVFFFLLRGISGVVIRK